MRPPGCQGLGAERSKDLRGLVRTNIRFCKDHRNSKEHTKKLNFSCHALSIAFVQLIF